MRIAPLSSIVFGERQRKTMDKVKLADLGQSIRTKGLLHPIVVQSTPEGLLLIAGERRYTAIKAIADEGVMFYHDNQPVEPGFIPYSFTSDLSENDLFELEFEENYLREDLTWQDRARALAELHRRRQQQNPEQTALDTAREIVAKVNPENADPDSPKRSLSVSQLRQVTSQASLLQPYMEDPAVLKARTMEEALKLVLDREQRSYQAQLIRTKAARRVDLDVTVRQADMLEEMQKLDANQFDLILTDPPYGLNAGSESYRARTVHHHNYEDTPDHARNILRTLLVEGWRVCKTNANIMIFTDISHWSFLCSLASQMGWDVWKWPVIWQKSEAEGFAPWGTKGFAHTYDIIFFAKKGDRGLNRVEIDILTEKRVSRSLRTHAAEKPLALLELILDITTTPGDKVLDPCAGSGSTLVAAKRMRRHGLGLELDQASVDLALVRLQEVEEGQTQDAALPAATDLNGLPKL